MGNCAQIFAVATPNISVTYAISNSNNTHRWSVKVENDCQWYLIGVYVKQLVLVLSLLKQMGGDWICGDHHD